MNHEGVRLPKHAGESLLRDFAEGWRRAPKEVGDVHAKSPADIVLVHGAFANTSSWSKLILLLMAKGFSVVAVHCPLSSLADDAAAERVIGMQDALLHATQGPFAQGSNDLPILSQPYAVVDFIQEQRANWARTSKQRLDPRCLPPFSV
jgi:hypothetical protein